jgi:hypothetical protein
MLQLTGKVIDIVSGQNTDQATGQISTVHSAEILHKVRGKSEIASVKLDPSVVEPWTKAVGRDVSVEIRFYAMKTREGSILSGLTLADKKSLPTVHRPAAQAA